MAPLLRIFSRGQREILNFCRRLQAAGGLTSSFYSLLKFCQEPRSSIFNALGFAPVSVLSFALCHGRNMAQGSSENAEIKAGNVRNVLR
jgi:hypothetical protein